MLSAKTAIEKLKTSQAMQLLKTNGALEKFKTMKVLETLKTSNVSPGWFAPLRMLGNKTALGIDISDKQINLALVKRTRNGAELLKYAAVPVPDGAIQNGIIENIGTLADAIKELKNSNGIRTTQTAVALFTKPVVVQIMGVPKQIPSNIGQFIQEQVKHFAVLPGNKIAFDFCGIGRGGADTNLSNRLLVAAADERKVHDIVKVCNQAGLVVEAIEPPLLAYARALYAKNIAGKYDNNVLIAILQEEILTLCVFRKETIDFVRTKNIEKEKTDPEQLCQWLTEQINLVIQFYDVETPDSSGQWETVIVADYKQIPAGSEESLKAKVASTNLQLLTNEDISKNAVSAKSSGLTNQHDQIDKPSPVAIGLAMKLLDIDSHNLGVNLLPQEVVRLRTTQRDVLVTANIIAVMFLLMALATTWPNFKIRKINDNLGDKKSHLLSDTHTLVRKQESLNKQIKTVTNKLDQISEILGSYHETKWSDLLNDIGKRIPKIARITSLSNTSNSVVLLKGLALSNEAVYLFADMLNDSEYLTSAAIIETNKDKNGLVKYEINCVLATINEK